MKTAKIVFSGSRPKIFWNRGEFANMIPENTISFAGSPYYISYG
jgi:hypothetical protein